MLMRCFGLYLLSGAIVTALHAQAPAIAWQRCLGGTDGEYAWGVQLAADGGIAMLGTTISTDGDVEGNHGLDDFWLVKLDSSGTLLWQRCYGGMLQEKANGLLATSDGGFLMLGVADSFERDVTCGGLQFQPKAWAVKVDEQGEIQWQSCLWGDPGAGGAAWGRAVEIAGEGYLVVGGSPAHQGIWHENHGGSDIFVAKLDQIGQVQWLHCYGGSGREDGFAIQATPDGNYVVAGVTGSSDGQVSTGDIGQIWVFKIDPEGNLLWNRRMGGSSGPGLGQSVRDIAVDLDGSILVACTVGANDGDISGNHGALDFWLVRLSPDVAILNQRCLGGSGRDVAWAINPAGGGRFVVAGHTGSNNDGDVSGRRGGVGDAWVVMVDAGLNLIWQKCLGGSRGDAAYAMARTPAGEVVIAGVTDSNDGDVSGLYPGPHGDIWVVKLESDLDVGVASTPEQTVLTAFPSPANDKVNVQLPAELGPNGTLEVLDITGRIVLQRPIEPGARSLQIAVEHLPGGMYSLHLRTLSGMVMGRFVKQ